MTNNFPYTLLSDIEINNIIRRSSELHKNDVVLDLGPFLGGSTTAIILGLKQTEHQGESNSIHCYDRFELEKSSTLGKIVLNQMTGSKHESNHNIINFLPLFEENIHKQIKGTPISLEVARGEIQNLKSLLIKPKKNQRVGLIHVDLPKSWKGLKPIMEEMFTRCIDKTIILWQDYFYHYSSDLIITCSWLLENKLLRLNRIAHTTLDTTLIRNLSIAELDELEDIIYSQEKRSYYLKKSTEWVASKGLDEYLTTSIVMAEILDLSLPGCSKQTRNKNANLLLNQLEQNPAMMARRIVEIFEDLNGQRKSNNW